VSQNKILIVDDTIANIKLVAGLLQSQAYEISYATHGEQALELVTDNLYDLILLDILMPGIDGYEVCLKIRKDPRYTNIPIIFLTANTNEKSIVKAYECGGQDYITKPFSGVELIARVRTFLKLKNFEDSLQNKIDAAMQELKSLNKEIEETQKEVIFTMGAIGETRSKETGYHVKRVAEYSNLFAILLDMDEAEAELIKMASPMHDIGKVGIPDNILNKPGKLTANEFEIMKTHVSIGHEMLKHSNRSILKAAAIIAYEHHEKWDGSGYPQAIAGEDIHIYGRISALADVFDALGSNRCYKKAWADEDIFKLLKEQRGIHFDPQLIDLFFQNLDQFLAIRAEYVDVF